MDALVLYTSKLVAGVAMVVTSPVLLKLTRGTSMPFDVLLTSSMAEAWAAAPVLFTDKLWVYACRQVHKAHRNIKADFIIPGIRLVMAGVGLITDECRENTDKSTNNLPSGTTGKRGYRSFAARSL